MFKGVGRNLWATRIFFLVRFVASVLIGFVYLMVAAGVQHVFVTWFGESTFNYIIGGILSLALGALVCRYIGRLVFMFVRGWHMGALAYSRTIIKKHMPALDVGIRVMSKHLSSFAVVYGASALVGKYVTSGVEKLWKLLDDVPYLGTLTRIRDNTIVRRVASDLLDTGFDACVYYLVKYTEPGMGDDLEAIPDAMRRYLYSLPSVMLASLSAYFLLYLLPRALKWVCVGMIVLSQGIVAGILINVLMFPVFYILEHSVFDPLETIILVSAFAKRCNEEIPEESPTKTIVDDILEGLGVGELGSDDGSPVEKIKRKVRDAVDDIRGVSGDTPEVDTQSDTQAVKSDIKTETPKRTDAVTHPRAEVQTAVHAASGLSAIPLDTGDDDEEDESGDVTQGLASLADAFRAGAFGVADVPERREISSLEELTGSAMAGTVRNDRPQLGGVASAFAGLRPEDLEFSDDEADDAGTPPAASAFSSFGVSEGEDEDGEIVAPPVVHDVPAGAKLASMLGGISAEELNYSLNDDEEESENGSLGGGSIGIM